MPALAAPDPSPVMPLPGPVPRPIPVPSPEPPSPLLAVPEGDIAIEPGVLPLGTPFADPGSLETTTPFPPPLPPAAVAGGASTEPASFRPPMPAPRVPLPRRVRASPPLRFGGGGTIFADPRVVPEGPCPAPRPELSEDIDGGGGTMLSAVRTVPKPPGVELWPRPPAVMEVPPLTLGGGGTT